MKCNICESENTEGAKFCQECGKEIILPEKENPVKNYNKLYLVLIFILPILWIIIKSSLLNSPSVALRIAEATGGAFVIIILSLIAPSITLVIKKSKKQVYKTFARDVFWVMLLISIILFFVQNENINSNQMYQYEGREISFNPESHPKALEYLIKAIKYAGSEDYYTGGHYIDMLVNMNIFEGYIGKGYMYYNGKGTPKDLSKAYKFYKKACSMNIPKGCDSLAKMYLSGEHVPKDVNKAKELLKLKSRSDYEHLGYVFKSAGYPFEAFELFKKGCNLGDGLACFWVGSAYQDGKGVRQSDTEALEMYGKGCDLKDGPCCTMYSALQKGE